MVGTLCVVAIVVVAVYILALGLCRAAALADDVMAPLGGVPPCGERQR
jgi:hypothetical protein